jgi:hypothetical protein
MTGYYNLLARSNPRTYLAIERNCIPIANFLAKFHDTDFPKFGGVESPSGSYTLPDGTKALLIAKYPVVIRIYLARPAHLLLQADWFPLPAGDNAERTVLVGCNSRQITQLSFDRPKAIQVEILLEEGTNQVTLEGPQPNNLQHAIGITGLKIALSRE